MDRRLCGDLPENLIESIRSGRALEDGQTAARQLFENAKRWFGGDGLPGSELRKLESDERFCNNFSTSASSTDTQFVPEAKQVKKYMFSDEHAKGIVKVYIECKHVDGKSFNDAHADFTDRTLHLRLVCHDGVAYAFDANLFGAIKPESSKCTLSSTGHKVSITLKKADVGMVWHRLMSAEGTNSSQAQEPGVERLTEFI